ncbi:MAG: tetratricopeptide repeat protein [Ignavibacteria bacterium]
MEQLDMNYNYKISTTQYKFFLALFLCMLSVNLLFAGDTEDNEKAKTLFIKGNSLYEEGKYSEAIENYTKSLEYTNSVKNPELLYNLSISYGKLGKSTEAKVYLDCYNVIKSKAVEKGNSEIKLSMFYKSNMDIWYWWVLKYILYILFFVFIYVAHNSYDNMRYGITFLMNFLILGSIIAAFIL